MHFLYTAKTGQELHFFAFFKDKFPNIYSDSRFIETQQSSNKFGSAFGLYYLCHKNQVVWNYEDVYC